MEFESPRLTRRRQQEARDGELSSRLERLKEEHFASDGGSDEDGSASDSDSNWGFM